MRYYITDKDRNLKRILSCPPRLLANQLQPDEMAYTEEQATDAAINKKLQRVVKPKKQTADLSEVLEALESDLADANVETKKLTKLKQKLSKRNPNV